MNERLSTTSLMTNDMILLTFNYLQVLAFSIKACKLADKKEENPQLNVFRIPMAR